MSETLLKTLTKLHFTEYEAKAYLALLEESPLTGYAVAKKSGVPRSRIYETLDHLAGRGDILVSPGTTPQYTPIPAKELIKNRRREANDHFKLAEKSLAEFKQSSHDRDNIWNITGRNEIIDKVKNCIATAQTRILLEVMEEEYEEVEEELRQATLRGVNVTIIAYGDISSDFAHVHLHYMGSAIKEEYGGNWIVISADDVEVVAGIVSLGTDSRAAWTRHVGLVMPITEVMIHDLYLMEIMKEHRDELEKTFGKNLVNLRRKFSIHPDFKKHYLK